MRTGFSATTRPRRGSRHSVARLILPPTEHPLWRSDRQYSPLFKHLPTIPPPQQAEILRRLSLDDLYFFSKYILGYWWLCCDEYGPHGALCWEIQQDRNLSLFLLPRGHCKTKIFSVADTIRHYLRCPSEPIALGSDKLGRASKRLSEIKHHFEGNALLNDLFLPTGLLWSRPDRQARRWREDEIDLPGHQGQQEASITAFGLHSLPTGSHFSRIKLDDIITPENSRSIDVMDTLREAYGHVRSSILRTGPDANLSICGTIYDDSDLHCEMLRSEQYRTYLRPAIEERTDKGGALRRRALWPVQYDLDTLHKIESDITVGKYLFSCQYLLDPAPEDEKSYFQLGWWPRYTRLPYNLRHYASADLAIAEHDGAAYTAIVVVGVSEDDEIYVVDVEREHMDSAEIVGTFLHVQIRYRLPETNGWAVEQENIARAIGPFIAKRFHEEGLSWRPYLYTPHNDKEARARGIQGRARQGAIHLPARGPNEPKWLRALEYEIRRFPRGKTKDQVDALSGIGMLLDKLRRPWTEEERLAVERIRHNPFDPITGY